MRRIFILLLFFLLCLSSKAQPSLYFEKLTTEHGLSHNKVNCIIEDKRGFIWIGTSDGLNRFDGKNFLHYYKRSSDPTSISGNIITDLLEDKDGIIWIATSDGGLNRYDYRLPPKQQFKSYRQLADKSSVNIINTLIEDRFGHLWVGTSGHSVLRFDKKKEQFEMPVQYGTKTILDLSTDKNGIIWAGRQGGGILKVNPHTLSSYQDGRYLNLYAKLPHASVTALYQDRDKNMWYGSWDKVLYRFNWRTQDEEVFQTSSTSFSFNNDQVNAFAEDTNGRIWMGGNEQGLQVFDKARKRFYQYRYDPTKEGSLSDNHINCIFIDKKGMVWIGTNRGLSIVDQSKQQFSQTFLPVKEKESSITIFDFFEADRNTIWIGTSNGLYIYHPEANSFIHRRLAYKGRPLQVTKFFRDVDGRIYLGTNVSLFVYDASTGNVSLLPNTDKDKVMNQIIDSRVVSIVRDTIEGHPALLVAPYGHYLAYYDLTDQKWVSRLDSARNIIDRYGLEDNLIRKFVKDSRGAVWMATAKKGLGVWQENKPVHFFENIPDDHQSISSNHVFDMTEDGKGNLWVSTYGGGLHFFDGKKQQFEQVASTNNLVEGLQTDIYGNVWTVSNGNVHIYDPRRGIYGSYELPDLEKTGGIKGMIFKDSQGFLYVAGTNYFVRFHPDSTKSVASEPKVCLTDFSIFNKSFSHLLFGKEIQLRYKDNYFTIEYAAPHFSSNVPVRYAYRLEGFDKDWVAAGSRNFVSYSNLDGGKYTFKVRASVSPGVWSKEVSTLHIVVIPPYWKQPWFYIVCMLVMTGIVYSLYRYRINEIVKRQAIRNRIAQDLHDNVGSTLSSISVYSQVAKIYHNQEKQDDLEQTLEKISTASSEMISELNDTVWAINPRNDHMNVILQRMESFARPLLSSKNIKFHFEYDKNLASVNLSMEKRKNFYLIFKEAIHNSLKYSGCTSLSVAIRHKGNELIMKIEDNGNGFDLTKTSEGYKSSDVFGGGNGLRNMQLRAKQMKGKLNITSEPGKGTRIEVIFPITGFGDAKSKEKR
jgi:ligand-binding sensor domain-containing protein/two-component sensor histidine kinase